MKTQLIILLSCFFVLFACSGSDSYQGNWKATTSNGEELEIIFEPKKMIINKSGETDTVEYKQHEISYENGQRTYGIRTKDGRSYYIYFPIAKNSEQGVILSGNNQPVYVIDREEHLSHDDLYRLD